MNTHLPDAFGHRPQSSRCCSVFGYNVAMSLSDLDGYLSEFEPPPTAGLEDAKGWLGDPVVCLALVSSQLFDTLSQPPDGIDAGLERLSTAEAWPTFTIELSRATSLHVVWRNDGDESGVDLLLFCGEGVHHLSNLDGHSMWPGLSWNECIQIAGRVSNLTPAEALVVLFPFVGDDLGPAAVEVLTGTLTRLGVRPDRTFINQLASAAGVRDQLAQTAGPAWGDRDGATTFLGRGSLRGPASPASFRQLIDRCLNGGTP